MLEVLSISRLARPKVRRRMNIFSFCGQALVAVNCKKMALTF
jgi:hypothetical protein